MSRLLVLPDRTGTAVDNMALDLALLEHGLTGDVLLFRHYEWSEPAYSFGVSQSYDFARAIAGPGPMLVRRASGGGVVNHLTDWTYALLAPAGHPLATMKATGSYRLVHEAVAAALAACGAPATLVPCPRESCAMATPAVNLAPPRKPGACFAEPEVHDVVRADDGRKLAGAAQKRTRAGILFQGYVDRPAAGIADWRRFGDLLATHLAEVCGARIDRASGFPVTEAQLADTRALFESEAWNTRRERGAGK